MNTQIILVKDLMQYELLNHVAVSQIILNDSLSRIDNLKEEFKEHDKSQTFSNVTEYLKNEYFLLGLNREILKKLKSLIKYSKLLINEYGWGDNGIIDNLESEEVHWLLTQSNILRAISNKENTPEVKDIKPKFHLVPTVFFIHK